MSRTDSRLLVIDDFESARMILRDALEQAGYQRIDDAVDGRDALGKLHAASERGDPYALVFCDVKMPELDGIELLERIRSDPRLGQVPVIMVSAESELPTVASALRKGANDYVLKPYTTEALRKKMDTVWARLAKAAGTA